MEHELWRDSYSDFRLRIFLGQLKVNLRTFNFLRFFYLVCPSVPCGDMHCSSQIVEKYKDI